LTVRFKGCGRLCPDDDALVADEANAANEKESFMLSGYWSCAHGKCFEDDLASGGLRGMAKKVNDMMSK
jgi:hypothetical protein